MASSARGVTEIFERQYAGSPDSARVFRAPGRVNLIGEHTDYSLGFVLPIAIEFACYIAAAPSKDGIFRVWSENEQELREWQSAELGTLKPSRHWTDYVIGVAQQLLARGVSIDGMNLAISSSVPVGSGLSSSAAIEVSSALALLYGRKFEKRELPILCQAAENQFVGMPCGIMDQYVSVFGEAHKAIRIDCRTITHEAVSLPDGAAIVAVNSMVKHELGSSAYGERVRECREAVEVIRRHRPDVQTLRDVSSAEVESLKSEMTDVVFRRARHVTSEDERVQQFMKASEAGDLKEMGKLFVQSHRSLQHDYEVSCEELDFLVDTAVKLPGVYGARMTGGGFGGCTVNLVDPKRVDDFESAIVKSYQERYGITANVFRCAAGPGASEVTA